MNADLIFLFIRRVLNDIADNKFLHGITLITIMLSVLIVSTIGLFFVNVNSLMKSWKKDLRIIVYLKQDASEPEIQAVRNQISAVPEVEKRIFISKQDALETLKNQLKHEYALFENLARNPLPDAFEIYLKPSEQSWEQIEVLAAQMKTLTPVEDVEYGRQLLSRFIPVLNFFAFTGIVLSGLFGIVSIFIIANTIRLALYSRQDEIEIMRLVGADEGYIKTPFYIEAMVQGVIGGAGGLLILAILFWVFATHVKETFSAYSVSIHFFSPQISCGIVFISMQVGWLGCYLALKKFLKI